MRALVHVGLVSVPSSLFRGFTSLWKAQESRRHLLEVLGQELIMLESSQLMACPVEWECLAKAEVARSQLHSDLWCSLINSLAWIAAGLSNVYFRAICTII